MVGLDGPDCPAKIRFRLAASSEDNGIKAMSIREAETGLLAQHHRLAAAALAQPVRLIDESTVMAVTLRNGRIDSCRTAARSSGVR